MQQGMSESLARRYEMIRLAHWSFAEMSAAFGFDLSHYVYFGGYPGAAGLVHEQDRWRAYVTDAIVEPNIERDILAMQRVDKPALLRRVFELGAQYSGQTLVYNKMLGQLQNAGNTTTLTRYLQLLERAGLIAGMPNSAGAEHRRRATSPKLNVLNTAFMSALSGYTFEEAKVDRSFWGCLVESTVGAHLLNSEATAVRVHYWRDRKGREVVERSRTVEEFRGCDAYVLLGAPGVGKTTEFRHEVAHSGGHYVTARDFLTFDERPEWRGTTLYIDGLDEMRAGSPDGRTPLDGIRRRLDALGRPRFRLSCRDADWFEDNDRRQEHHGDAAPVPLPGIHSAGRGVRLPVRGA